MQTNRYIVIESCFVVTKKSMKPIDKSQSETHRSDQTPIPFVFNKNITYHHFKEKQHGTDSVEGFDKQQCKLQARFKLRAELGIIFRGKTRQKTEQNRTRMYIFNIFIAWADTTRSIQWGERILIYCRLF